MRKPSMTEPSPELCFEVLLRQISPLCTKQEKRGNDEHRSLVRMIESSPLARSLKSLSTSSSPARTSIASELGFVYRLFSTALRNAVKVYSICQMFREKGFGDLYFKGIFVSRAHSSLDFFDGSSEECLGLDL